MMLPECAPVGTVTIRPEPSPRRRAPGELRLMRAPGLRGKATTIPALRPRPVSASVPCTDTWWGLVLQWLVGVQAALVMRTEVTCALGVLATPRAADLAVTASVRQKMENPADRASEQHPSNEEIWAWA